MRPVLFFASTIAALVWITYFALPSKNLKIIACDVGQGDAILIIQNQTQILVDGGPDKSVISCLGEYMPFWDRNLELIIMTHPEADHITGLVGVFSKYKVNSFLTSEVGNSTDTFKVLKDTVGGSGVRVLNPQKGMSIRLGLTYLDILHGWEGDNNNGNVLGAIDPVQNLNDYSIVFSLKYGNFEGIFAGDIGPEVTNEIVWSGLVKNVEYIKIPHHGSKNGLTQLLLNYSDPEVAVISVGKDNRFGHPHQEILDMLNDKHVKILRTDLMGDVVVETNGDTYWVK